MIRLCWSTQGLWWNGWLLKKCMKVVFCYTTHPTAFQTHMEVPVNTFSQRLHPCGLGEKKHKPAALWTELSAKSEINGLKVFTTGSTLPNWKWNVFKIKIPTCKFQKFFHDEILVNKARQGKSKHFFFFSIQRTVHHEKKTAGGEKKLPIQRALSN